MVGGFGIGHGLEPIKHGHTVSEVFWWGAVLQSGKCSTTTSLGLLGSLGLLLRLFRLGLRGGDLGGRGWGFLTWVNRHDVSGEGEEEEEEGRFLSWLKCGELV